MFAESRNQGPPLTFFADFLLNLALSARTVFEFGIFRTLFANSHNLCHFNVKLAEATHKNCFRWGAVENLRVAGLPGNHLPMRGFSTARN